MGQLLLHSNTEELFNQHVCDNLKTLESWIKKKPPISFFKCICICLCVCLQKIQTHTQAYVSFNFECHGHLSVIESKNAIPPSIHQRYITCWHPFHPLNINPVQWYNGPVNTDSGEALPSPWLYRCKSFYGYLVIMLSESKKGRKIGRKEQTSAWNRKEGNKGNKK